MASEEFKGTGMHGYIERLQFKKIVVKLSCYTLLCEAMIYVVKALLSFDEFLGTRCQ